jgi:AraC-like DNA-binding protein
MKDIGILDGHENLGILPPSAVVLPCRSPNPIPDSLVIYTGMGDRFTVELASGELRLGPDDVCLIAPNLRHGLGGKGRVSRVAITRSTLLGAFAPVVSFCPLLMEFFLRCQDEPAGLPYLRFSHRGGETARPLIERTSREFAARRPSYQSAIINALAELFVLLTRDYYASEPVDRLPAGGKADLILGYLCERYATSTLESTARHFHCHPNTIATILRESLGKNFSELRRELRLSRACLLLAQTALPISEVASLCGYENMTSFYKAFKEKYGTTPGLFSAREAQEASLKPA